MSENTMSAMEADLKRSGLSPSDMDTTEVVQVFGGAVTGYRIPYYLPDGTLHPFMHRVRNTIKAPGVPRYHQPSTEDIVKLGGTKLDATMPYLNPRILGTGGVTWAKVATVNNKRLLLVEGEKKAVATGLRLKKFAVGIGGCWNAVARNDEGVFGLHPGIRALLQPGDKVEVVFDADIISNELVNRAAGTLRRAFLRLGVTPVFVMLPEWRGQKMGIDDWLILQAAGTEQAAYDALPRMTDGFNEDHVSLWDWLGLIRNDAGKVLPIEQNLHLLLTKHERYVGKLWYDVVEQRIWHTLNGEPQQFTDDQAFHEASWMQRGAGLLNVRRGPVLEAFLSVPALPSLHRNPLVDDIEAERWDGTPRLEEMFITGFGAEDNEYHRDIGRNWLKSAVVRALSPGCQVDTMLILEGVQGIGKSQALKIIGGKWYVELRQAIGEKDFVMSAHHGWIADIIELGAFKYADFTHVKGEITTRIDSIRVPYGRSIEDRPRGFVFVGTTNTKDYLRDDTGNRRFWPVACNATMPNNKINLAWIAANRQQLLAEAYARIVAGETWWEINEDAATAVQDARMELDPWEEDLNALLSNPANFRAIPSSQGMQHFITTGEILHALGVETQFQNSGLMRRVSRLMSGDRFGWAPYHYNGRQALILSNGQTTKSARGYVYPAATPPGSTGVVDFPQQRASKF